MARPALSAARTTDILDLFAAFPGRSFTMSEIMRAAGINVASCHAVLSVLTQRGYLSRRESDKSYSLGPALLCVGHAALLAQPLAVRAQEAAAQLFEEIQRPVLLSTIAGDEILALAAFVTPDGRHTGLRIGQRAPLIPPNGAHFIAWADEEEIAAWLARADLQDEAQIESLRHMLALVRRRGFQVTLRGPRTTEFATLMSQMAAGQPPLDYKTQVTHVLLEHGWALSQPEEIAPDESYDIVLIAAPIFDRAGHAQFSLGLGGFAEPMRGREILDLSSRLLETCLRVMREERGH